MRDKSRSRSRSKSVFHTPGSRLLQHLMPSSTLGAHSTLSPGISAHGGFGSGVPAGGGGGIAAALSQGAPVGGPPGGIEVPPGFAPSPPPIDQGPVNIRPALPGIPTPPPAAITPQTGLFPIQPTTTYVGSQLGVQPKSTFYPRSRFN